MRLDATVGLASGWLEERGEARIEPRVGRRRQEAGKRQLTMAESDVKIVPSPRRTVNLQLGENRVPDTSAAELKALETEHQHGAVRSGMMVLSRPRVLTTGEFHDQRHHRSSQRRVRRIASLAARICPRDGQAAAIQWYSQGLISQGKAAEIAGLDRTDFLFALAHAKVDAFQVTPEELKEEVELALQARRERLASDLPDASGAP